jgi:anaerobic magnesium-protoporphyrin IX monomethyl ester cyclase
MRVLLIYPPISVYERYSSDIGYAGGKQIPLGIYYLAAYIRERGHEVRVIDAEVLCWSNEQIVATVREFAPDVIGISTTTVAFHRARAVAASIKAEYPNMINVIGGPHPTAATEDVLHHPEFDYAVLGEGEESFAVLLETLCNGADAGSLTGVAWRDGETIIVNPRRPFIADIDALPFPAYDLVPDFSLYNPPPMNYKKLPVANIITSRGCPNQCTFCGHSSFGRTLRQRSPENIAEEIIHLYRLYRIREIAFVDDTFTINPHRIQELFRILDRQGICFPWTCMSRVNTVDESVLRFMKDHGCWHISFGIESGNEDILRRIKKNISLDSVCRAIGICHRLGILTKGFFIIGHPGETVETIEETIRFALEIPLDDVVVTLNTPLPGTEQYRTADTFGSLERGDWSRYNMWNPVFVPRGLTEETLLAKHREFYRRFYLRPRIVKRYAMSFLSATGLRRALSLMRGFPFLFKKRPGLEERGQ